VPVSKTPGGAGSRTRDVPTYRAFRVFQRNAEIIEKTHLTHINALAYRAVAGGNWNGTHPGAPVFLWIGAADQVSFADFHQRFPAEK
jgi:hypothetical protein